MLLVVPPPTKSSPQMVHCLSLALFVKSRKILAHAAEQVVAVLESPTTGFPQILHGAGILLLATPRHFTPQYTTSIFIFALISKSLLQTEQAL